MNAKDAALAIVKVATTIFPPLAELLASVLDRAPEHLRPLADEVREILPAEASIHAAVRELEDRNGDRR